MNMKVLSRLLMTVVLLSGLAYGSYAFGRFVLSTRLFGASVAPARGSNFALGSSPRVDGAVTRRTTLKGQSRVELEVLPAQDAGPGPEPPSISNLERETRDKPYVSAAPPRTRLITPKNFKAPRAFSRINADDNGNISTRRRFRSDDNQFSSSNREEERPRRRRRRRRRTVDSSSTSRTRTVRSQRSDSSSDGESSGSSEGRRSRRRESTRDSSSQESRSEAPRRERSDSPTPRAESGSSGGSSDGGESPIPQPE
jgi:hypothetical protein